MVGPIVIVIVITTYHAVYWSYQASRTDRWFLPCSIPWVPGLPEVAHSMTEDPEDRGYRPTRLWGEWQLQSFSISNGDGRWPVGPLGVKGKAGQCSCIATSRKQGRLLWVQCSNQGTKQHACGEARTGPLFDAHFRHRWDAPHLRPCAFSSQQRTHIRPLTHSQGLGGLQPSLALSLHRPLVLLEYVANPA